MKEYYIVIGDSRFNAVGSAAYTAYLYALDFGKLLDHDVALVDAETGEILLDNTPVVYKQIL